VKNFMYSPDGSDILFVCCMIASYLAMNKQKDIANSGKISSTEKLFSCF